MNLKETLNEYFAQTEIPSELHPDNIQNILGGKGKAIARKEPASPPKHAAKSAPTPARTAPLYEISREEEEDMEAYAPPKRTSRPAEEHPPTAPRYEVQTHEESSSKASELIKVMHRNKLTGNEFLSLLGNSKISNSTYQEIKNNPSMTVKRLIELLEQSPLTDEDYNRLMIAVERTAALKEEARSKAARQADAGLFFPKSSAATPLDSVVDTYDKKAPSAAKSEHSEKSTNTVIGENTAGTINSSDSVGTATQIIREMDLKREAKNIISKQETFKEHIPPVNNNEEEDGRVKQNYSYRIGSLKKGLDGTEEISVEEAPPAPAYTHEDYINAAQSASQDDYEEQYEDEEDEEEKESRSKRKLLFGMHGEDSEEDYEDDDDLEKPKRKKSKAKKSSKKSKPAENDDNYDDEDDEDYTAEKDGKPYDDDDDDNDYDDDDDNYDDFGRKKKGSNKGKIIIAAVGAVALIAISFGIRYFLTGSFLPTENVTVEKQLDEGAIFDQLSILPPQTALPFTQNENYTAGKPVSPKPLTNMLSLEKRLLFVSNNTLYTFEQIGGQLEKLSEKVYPETVKVLGLIGGNNGVAVVLKAENEDYSYSYSVTGENGADTVINGTVQRPVTQIDLLNPANPEKLAEIKSIKISGDLTAIYKLENRLLAVTSENIPDAAVKEDYATFMPYVSAAEKTLCSAENVLITGKSACKSFTAICTLDFDGNADIKSVAGGSSQLIYQSGNKLFVAQESFLAEYDLSEGIPTHTQSIDLEGGIADFSAIGFDGEEIRVTTLNDGSAVLNVLDYNEENKLQKKSQVKNIGESDTFLTTCFNGRETYIIAEGSKCYGIDGEDSAIAETGSKITSAKVYPFNDKIGIRLAVLDDGQERTGLQISTVKLDGTMTEIDAREISSRTVAKNSVDKYISSPAEEDIYHIGCGENTVVVPLTFFDGVSEVEFFAIYSVDDSGMLSYCGNVSEYDRHSKNIFAAVNGETVIAVTDGKIITAKAENGNVIGYFNY